MILDRLIQEGVWQRSMYFKGINLRRKVEERITKEMRVKTTLVVCEIGRVARNQHFVDSQIGRSRVGRREDSQSLILRK